MKANSRMRWARHVAHMGNEKYVHVNWKTQKHLNCDFSINGSILLKMDLKEFQASIPSSGFLPLKVGTSDKTSHPINDRGSYWLHCYCLLNDYKELVHLIKKDSENKLNTAHWITCSFKMVACLYHSFDKY
jgi:hypothetical protein